MQRRVLAKYLTAFKRIYPMHPDAETWDIYERVLAPFSDLEISAACEICLRELKYFPMPAEVCACIARDNFVVTTEPPTDNPMPPHERITVSNQIKSAGKKLGKPHKDLRPEWAKTDKRPSAQWSPEECKEFMAAVSGPESEE